MAGNAAVAERHSWAVELLDIAPGERVLEVGCGHGIATGLALVAGARVTAIDQSARMVEACRKRNAGADALEVREGTVEGLAFDAPFDRAFAVNVDFPRHPDRGWAQKFAGLMKPGGTLVLVLEAPGAPTAERFALAASAALTGVGFSVETLGAGKLAAVRGVRLAAANRA